MGLAYLGFLELLLRRVKLGGLHRDDDHLVGRAEVLVLSLLDRCLIIDGHSAGEREGSLVDLIVLLAYDSLHESQPVLDVAIEGGPFAVSCLVHFPEVCDGGLFFPQVIQSSAF